MKIIVFVIILFGAISLRCFSQTKYDFNSDLSALSLKLAPLEKGVKTYDLNTDCQNEALRDLGSNNENLLSGNERKDDTTNNDWIEEQRYVDRMPCLNPVMQSKMPISEPDSTIRFTLLLKHPILWTGSK